MVRPLLTALFISFVKPRIMSLTLPIGGAIFQPDLPGEGLRDVQNTHGWSVSV
jgi:hypothetical protein